MTTITMSSVSPSVVMTSWMASRTYSVEWFGMPSFMPAGSCTWIPRRDGIADPADHFQRVRGREHPDAHERRCLAVEADVILVALGAEHDIRNLAEPDDDAVFLGDDELLELVGRTKVGVGDEVHRHHRALGPAERQR